MGNDRNQKYKNLQKYFEPTYDSDEDLPVEEKNKIREKEMYGKPGDADAVRESAWDNQGAFPKIKKVFKTAYYGDKRKKD